MANIKSAIKRAKLSEERRVRNTTYRSDMRSSIKRAEAAIASNDLQSAKEAVAFATSKLDIAVSKGVIHKNYATRHKSRLMKSLNKLEA